MNIQAFRNITGHTWIDGGGTYFQALELHCMQEMGTVLLSLRRGTTDGAKA